MYDSSSRAVSSITPELYTASKRLTPDQFYKKGSQGKNTSASAGSSDVLYGVNHVDSIPYLKQYLSPKMILDWIRKNPQTALLITEGVNLLLHGIGSASAMFFNLGGTLVNIAAIFSFAPSQNFLSDREDQGSSESSMRVRTDKLSVSCYALHGDICSLAPHCRSLGCASGLRSDDYVLVARFAYFQEAITLRSKQRASTPTLRVNSGSKLHRVEFDHGPI